MDAGRYEVTARNEAGEASAGCDVAVKVKPLSSVNESSISSISLSVPTVVTTTLEQPLSSEVTATTIIIKEANTEESTKTTTAKAEDSTLISQPTMELMAPRIQLPLKDVDIVEGASTRLDCVIVGQPEPEVRLYIFFSRLKIFYVNFLRPSRIFVKKKKKI